MSTTDTEPAGNDSQVLADLDAVRAGPCGGPRFTLRAGTDPGAT
jgi:hypothetical protein